MLKPFFPEKLIAVTKDSLQNWAELADVQFDVEITEKEFSAQGIELEDSRRISRERVTIGDYCFSKWRIDFDPLSKKFDGGETGSYQIKSRESFSYDGESVSWLLLGQEIPGGKFEHASQGRVYPLKNGDQPDLSFYNPLSYTFPRILIFAGVDPVTSTTRFQQGEIIFSSDRSIEILNLTNCLRTKVKLASDDNSIESFELASFDPYTGRENQKIVRKIEFIDSVSSDVGSFLLPKKVIFRTTLEGKISTQLILEITKVNTKLEQPSIYALDFPAGTRVNDENLGRVYRAGKAGGGFTH